MLLGLVNKRGEEFFEILKDVRFICIVHLTKTFGFGPEIKSEAGFDVKSEPKPKIDS